MIMQEGYPVNGKQGNELLQAFGWSFNPILAPVFFQINDNFKASPNQYLIIRDDTHEVLSDHSVVTSKYTTKNNSDFLNYVIEAFNLTGFSLNRGGVIRNGKYIWCIGAANKPLNVKKDEVFPMVFVAQSNDGVNNGIVHLFIQRKNCNNIFFGDKKCSQRIDFIQSPEIEQEDILSKFQKKAKNKKQKEENKLVNIINKLMQIWKEKIEVYSSLAETKIENPIEIGIKIFDIKEKNIDEIKGRDRTKLTSLMKGFNDKSLYTYGSTLWDLFNSFSAIYSHTDYGRKEGFSRMEDFLTSKMACREDRALSILKAHIK